MVSRTTATAKPPLLPEGAADFLRRRMIEIAGLALIVAIGFFVRRIAGDVAGVVAAVLAAVHPLMWINDIMLLSEGLYQPFVVLVLWAAYVWVKSPTPRNVIVLGITIALMALVRDRKRVV